MPEIKDGVLYLSGETGTKLKTEIVVDYYRFWLDVTTRGRGKAVRYVYIVEMNAGTGRLGNEETNEKFYGSAGHGLELKFHTNNDYPNMKLIFIEEHQQSREALLGFIESSWKEVKIVKSQRGYISKNQDLFIFEKFQDFLNSTEVGGTLGISLFYFDPLRAPNWNMIERIAKARIDKPFKMGTEFLIFFFTSDWVLGRKGFSPLPRKDNEESWSEEEKLSVLEADIAFGGRDWIQVMKQPLSDDELQVKLVQLYKEKLRPWFRFVQPLPFVPEENQLYHLVCCSNFSVGIAVLSKFYEGATNPFGIKEKVDRVYRSFKNAHPEMRKAYPGRRRPIEWRVLWQVMARHAPDGICDHTCRVLHKEIAKTQSRLKVALKWLESNNYLKRVSLKKWPWSQPKFPVYKINWETIEKVLGVKPPKPPEPLKPGYTVRDSGTTNDDDEYEQMSLS